MIIGVTDAAADNDDDEQDEHLCISILLLSRFNTVAVALLYCCCRVVILLLTRYHIAAVAPLYCCACVLIYSACVLAKAILIYVTVRRVHVDNNSFVRAVFVRVE